VRGPTHALAGACTTGLFLAFHIPHHYPLLILSGVGAIAALMPDLDGSESMIENIEIFGLKPLKIPAFFIDKMFKHRGFLHSLMAVALLAFILLGFFPKLPVEFVVAIVLGYTSHLLADGVTPQGVPWLYPIDWRPNLLPGFLTITTGSWKEGIVFIGLIGIYVAFLANAGYVLLGR
jgi:inner membrane protein